MDKSVNPLTTCPPTEVALPKAPLVRVIAQIRFPLIVSLERREFIAPFQETMRPFYPVLRQEQSQEILFRPQGISQTQQGTIWRFNDMEAKWRVSLAPNFVAIETTSYLSRNDFFARLAVVVAAVEKHFGPKIADRIGVRYIDRLTGDALNNIAKLVKPEILGILATSAGGNIEQLISESLFSVEEASAKLLFRQGRIPKDATVDPSAIDPIAEPSWILDIDMFRVGPKDFATQDLVSEARGFSERIYGMFRWAVTDDFLRHFGGSV